MSECGGLSVRIQSQVHQCLVDWRRDGTRSYLHGSLSGKQTQTGRGRNKKEAETGVSLTRSSVTSYRQTSHCLPILENLITYLDL